MFVLWYILHGVAWTQKGWLEFNVAPCFTSQVPHGYTRIPCVPVGWDSFEGWWWIGSHCHDDLFSFEIIMCLSRLEQPWPLHTWCSFSYLHLPRRIQCTQMPVSFLKLPFGITGLDLPPWASNFFDVGGSKVSCGQHCPFQSRFTGQEGILQFIFFSLPFSCKS